MFVMKRFNVLKKVDIMFEPEPKTRVRKKHIVQLVQWWDIAAEIQVKERERKGVFDLYAIDEKFDRFIVHNEIERVHRSTEPEGHILVDSSFAD